VSEPKELSYIAFNCSCESLWQKLYRRACRLWPWHREGFQPSILLLSSMPVQDEDLLSITFDSDGFTISNWSMPLPDSVICSVPHVRNPLAPRETAQVCPQCGRLI